MINVPDEVKEEVSRELEEYIINWKKEMIEHLQKYDQATRNKSKNERSNQTA